MSQECQYPTYCHHNKADPFNIQVVITISTITQIEASIVHASAKLNRKSVAWTLLFSVRQQTFSTLQNLIAHQQIPADRLAKNLSVQGPEILVSACHQHHPALQFLRSDWLLLIIL